MTIYTYPLFESHDDFVDQDFTVCRSSIVPAALCGKPPDIQHLSLPSRASLAVVV